MKTEIELSELLKQITPLLPLRTGDFRDEVDRSNTDPDDTHRSVFDPSCGNQAHVFDDNLAAYLTHCANVLPELVEALRSAVNSLSSIYSEPRRYIEMQVRVRDELKSALSRAEKVKLP